MSTFTYPGWCVDPLRPRARAAPALCGRRSAALAVLVRELGAHARLDVPASAASTARATLGQKGCVRVAKPGYSRKGAAVAPTSLPGSARGFGPALLCRQTRFEASGDCRGCSGAKRWIWSTRLSKHRALTTRHSPALRAPDGGRRRAWTPAVLEGRARALRPP